MNRKAFTLIELLVVVAIIGILAAVGVVAYNGYTSAAKLNVIKSSHASIVKYITAEITKCELGVITTMDGNFKCSDLNGSHPMNAALIAVEKALKDKFNNPMNSSSPSMCSSPANTCGPNYKYSNNNKSAPGVINIENVSYTQMFLGTCIAEPCGQVYGYAGKFGYIEAVYTIPTPDPRGP